mgnify:CR=1 FL=1|tara:strand:- start:30297 stop:32816 length:2520 start_codon:yes stop_codon:yes gene_type:complete
MAELTKPQYSNQKLYPSDRKVYQVQPERSDFARPSNIPNQSLTASRVFDSLAKSLDNFHGLYQQSENTANQLQARQVINNKLAHNANLKEMLTLHLPETDFQNIKLKDVIKKVRTIDGQGNSELFIGKNGEHNISIMSMPEGLSPEVEAMVEETFIREDTGFIGSLISQVGAVQQEQSTLILAQAEQEYKTGLFHDYANNGRYQGRQEAEKRRQILLSEITKLAETNSYNATEIRDKREKTVQMMLQAEFDYMYGREGVEGGRTAEQTRRDVLRRAEKGKFDFVTQNGKTIKLNPDYYQNRLYTTTEKHRQQKINEAESDEIDQQSLNLQNELKRIVEKGEITLESVFNNTYNDIVKHGEYDKIPRSQIFKMLHDRQLELLRKDASEEKIENASELQDQLSIMRSKLSTDKGYKENIKNYATLQNGKWEPKDIKTLKGLYGESFRKSHVRDMITAYDIGVTKNEKILKLAIEKDSVKSFISEQEARISAGAEGTANVLDDFANGKFNKKTGEVTYLLDEDKIQKGQPGYHRIQSLLKDSDFPEATEKQILATKKSILSTIINSAANNSRKLNEALLKEQKGQEVFEKDMTMRMDSITTDYINSLDAMIKNGDNQFLERTKPWDNKAPNLVQLNRITAYKSTLDRITDLVQNKKTYNLEDLKKIISDLNQYKLNGMPLGEEKNALLTRYTNVVSNHLESYFDNINNNPRATGFAETNQEAYFKENGKYDMGAYQNWLRKKGKEYSRATVISDETKEKIKNLNNINQEDATTDFHNLWNVLNMYGEPLSWGNDMAYKNIFNELPEKFKIDFNNMVTAKGVLNFDNFKASWSRGKDDVKGMK